MTPPPDEAGSPGGTDLPDLPDPADLSDPTELSDPTAGPAGSVAGCLFCAIVAGEIPATVVHTTDLTVAFRDIAPAAPVHVLVVPRRHIESAAAVVPADAEVVAALLTAAREVAEAEGIGDPERGYRLVINVGPDAQNSVPHLHLHVLGGQTMGWPPG